MGWLQPWRRGTHGALDDGFEDLVTEGLHQVGHHFPAVKGPRVVHRGEHAVDLQARIEAVLNLVDGFHEQRDGAQGEEFTDERDDDAVGGGQRVDGEEPE